MPTKKHFLCDLNSHFLLLLLFSFFLDASLLLVIFLLHKLFPLVNFDHRVDSYDVHAQLEKLDELVLYALTQDFLVLILPTDGKGNDL